MVTELQLGFINNSAQLAASRASANHNVHDAITDKTGGITFYLKLKALKEALADDPDRFITLKADLEATYAKFIQNGSAVYSLACDEESYAAIQSVPLPMRSCLTDALSQAKTELLSGNIALAAPCDIVFNGCSYNADRTLSGGTLLLESRREIGTRLRVSFPLLTTSDRASLQQPEAGFRVGGMDLALTELSVVLDKSLYTQKMFD